ncbi:hypothetical protein C1I64_04845 [Rathayibacter festucae DSM 15932]|uniref:Uncharacterized protein n=1 Tax=Rathayibacter festucae DSM 15932 TaxID=1328866 RepID=A0A3Q9UWG2_9MICO|nr:hypothetical protein C1I64_04845 [Rathayibacter festucae DSM 15932]
MLLMIRLIPYAYSAVVATRKGYKWLTAFAVYLIVVAVINIVFAPDSDVRALMAVGSCALLLLHVNDIPSRRGEK